MRILVVEDDLSLQSGISFKLSKEGRITCLLSKKYTNTVCLPLSVHLKSRYEDALP